MTFRVSAIAVSSSQIAPAVAGENPWALLSPAFLRTATARRVPNSGDEAFVRLRPGASTEVFLRAASALAGRYRSTSGHIFTISNADQVAATERAIRPDAVALALFAALAGVIALAIIGQLLSRQLVLDSAWFGALRALGMTRGRLVAVSLARAAAVSAAGGVLAAAIAIAVSPLMPIGPARLAEPAPGIDINLASLVAGLAIVVLVPIAVVAPVAWSTVSRLAPGPAEPAARPRPSRLGMALGRAGSVPGAIGVRMAFEPGHGRTAVPVRSALAAITVAVVAVTAAGVFGSSLIRLVDVPHRYGQNWNTELDLAFGAAPKSLLARLVSAQPGVTGYADGDYGEVTVKGQTVSAIGLTPCTGTGLSHPAGRPPARWPGPDRPRRPDPPVAAPANRPDGPGHSQRIRSGEPHGASDAHRGRSGLRRARPARLFTGTDLGNGALVAPSLLSTPFPQTGCTATCFNFVLLRYRPGISPGAAATRLISTVTAKGCPPGSCSVADDQRPADIQGYAGIRDTPLILGAMLVLLGVAALAHVLVTGVRRRRRDLAILKIVGMRKAQLLRVVSWQATALTSAALIVGIPLGIVAGRWSWALFAGSLGVAPGADVPAVAVVAEAAVALLLAVLIAAVPGRTAARVRPAASLRTE